MEIKKRKKKRGKINKKINKNQTVDWGMNQ